MDEQSEQIAELLGYAKETTNTLHEVQDDLTEVKEEVVIAKTYLVEKSFTSTKNPRDENKHHFFAATTYTNSDDEQIVKFISGQKQYVDKMISKRVKEDNHQIIIKPFYQANGIDLRQNVHDEFIKRRAERIKKINEENALADKNFNDQLKRNIRDHNKQYPDDKRIYANEKRMTSKIKVKDISVKFSKLSFVYQINEHIKFDEILQIILDVNEITQESPMGSETEEDA